MVNETTISNEEYYRLKRLEESVKANKGIFIKAGKIGFGNFYTPTDYVYLDSIELIQVIEQNSIRYNERCNDLYEEIGELKQTIKKLQNEKTISYCICYFINGLRKRRTVK